MVEKTAALALLEPGRWWFVPLRCLVEPTLTRLVAELIVSGLALHFGLVVLIPGLRKFLDEVLSLVVLRVLVVLLLAGELIAGLLTTLLLQSVVKADHLRCRSLELVADAVRHKLHLRVVDVLQHGLMEVADRLNLLGVGLRVSLLIVEQILSLAPRVCKTSSHGRLIHETALHGLLVEACLAEPAREALGLVERGHSRSLVEASCAEPLADSRLLWRV